MRIGHGTFVFGMVLYPDKKRMVFKFDDFNEARLGVFARCDEPGFAEFVCVLTVKLIAVAVALRNGFGAVNLMGERSRSNLAIPGTQSHGSAFFGHSFLIFHKVDDR